MFEALSADTLARVRNDLLRHWARDGSYAEVIEELNRRLGFAAGDRLMRDPWGRPLICSYNLQGARQAAVYEELGLA